MIPINEMSDLFQKQPIFPAIAEWQEIEDGWQEF